MTYFDAHKLTPGSRVFFPTEPIARVDGITRTNRDLHYYREQFYRTYKVTAIWTSDDRKIVRVQISCRDNRGNFWIDPIRSLEVCK